jgi:hypothetical protein
VEDRLPDDRWMIAIEPTGPTSRRFVLRVPEGVRAALVQAVAPPGP